VRAMPVRFRARTVARAQGQGVQFIWRGDIELDFSALTECFDVLIK
jgi:hypothetical protein